MLELRQIELRVATLTRSIDFYQRQLGFAVAGTSGNQAELSVAPGAPALLTLVEAPSAPRPPADAAGLFHAALLLPTRAALGGWLKHAAETGVEFDGFSDHGVSEAIYLRDPDGNGLEFYADRPRDTWPRHNGEIAMGTAPLHLPGLLQASKAFQVTPTEGGRWGHLHLRITELERSTAFYSTTLGVSVTQRSYPGARFLAADGYHHHLGLNTWGNPRQPQPESALGLVQATFAVPGTRAPRSVQDPDSIAIQLVPAS